MCEKTFNLFVDINFVLFAICVCIILDSISLSICNAVEYMIAIVIVINTFQKFFATLT